MESRFGHDFGRLRVHTDGRAASSARAMGARAYTVGSRIVFGQGESGWQTTKGRRLLAHELAHVVQQERGSTHAAGAELQQDRLEHQANAAEVGFAADSGRIHVSGTSGPYIARQPFPLGSGQPKSLTGSVSRDPYLTSNAALEEEIRLLLAWLDANPSTVDDDRLRAELADLQAEAERRKHTLPIVQPRKDPAKPGSLAALTNTVNETIVEVQTDDRYFTEAISAFAQSGQLIHRDRFAPIEIASGHNLSLRQRYDLRMMRMGRHVNNLEAADFNPIYFTSKEEFDREWARRREEYRQRFKACSDERGTNRPKCRDAVNAEYAPQSAALQDAAYRAVYADMQLGMPAVTDSGLAAAVAFHITHKHLGWSTERSASAAGLVGGLANSSQAVSKNISPANRSTGTGTSHRPDLSPPPSHTAPPPKRDPIPPPSSKLDTAPPTKPPTSGGSGGGRPRRDTLVAHPPPPPPAAPPKDVVEKGGRLERDTSNQPRHYVVKEHFGEKNAAGDPEARYYVNVRLDPDGLMRGDFFLRRSDGGQSYRSGGLRGKQEFDQAKAYFERRNPPGTVKGFEGDWSGGDNLVLFNQNYRAAKLGGASDADALRTAALKTKTGEWSLAAGFTNVSVVKTEKDANGFTEVTVRFER